MVQSIEQQTENVVKDTEGANVHLTKGIASARRARQLMWVCCILVTLIILALALGLGIYFGYILPKNKADQAAARAQQAQPTPTA
jgi:syntaxin 1B/2/3